MLHEEIRVVCTEVCRSNESNGVLNSGCYTPMGLLRVPKPSHVQEFYDRYYLMIDYPEVDRYRPLITDIVRPRSIELDGKGSEAALGVFQHQLTMVNDVSGRMKDVIATVLNTSYNNRERVLVVVPDMDYAGRFASSLSRHLWARFRYVRHHDFNIDRIERMEILVRSMELSGEGSRIVDDSVRRVTKDLLTSAYDDIIDSVGTSNFIMIDKADLIEHMSPVEGDGRLYLDFDRILVIGAEEFTIVDTMPLYTFNRPIAFFYGPLPDSMPALSDGYDVPHAFAIVLCSKYSEAMLYETESAMERYMRDVSEPGLWKSVEYDV